MIFFYKLIINNWLKLRRLTITFFTVMFQKGYNINDKRI